MSPTSYQTAPSRIKKLLALNFLVQSWCGRGGLEPPRPKALPPQGSVSTNSTTTAACGTHSSPSNYKRKALFRIIDPFLVHLVKFQAMLFELVLLFVQISNYMPQSSVFLQKQPRLNSSQKTVPLK